MKKWKKIVFGVLILFTASLLFLSWYSYRYSMETARSFEINDHALHHRILIATQGSDFKDEVVRGVTDELRTQQVYVKVIDISGLTDVQEAEWSAIVILHTWEYQKPPADIRKFIERIGKSDKIVLLITSGSGTGKLDGIDAVTSASKKSERNDNIREILKRVNAILNKDTVS